MMNKQKSMFPNWYWEYGLHDACITGIEKYEFPADHNKYDGKKNAHYKNLLRLRIDSSNALCDTSVSEIRLFDYEILLGDIEWLEHGEIWWLGDFLTEHNDGYVLEMDLKDFDSWPEELHFTVKFKYAEVDRKDR